MLISEILVYTTLAIAAFLSYRLRKLTLAGAFTGAIVSVLIFKGAGGAGLAMLALFFVAGTMATAWQSKSKAEINTTEHESSQRTAGQVLANGGMAALLSAIAWIFPEHRSLCQLMMAGSLASATADTLSSELGTIYGRRFFNIITFKTDQRGLDGVASIEGTLIGIGGAALIALVYSIGYGWGLNFCTIILAGFVGNIVDSVLGATLERKGIIVNNMVNFLNTLTGAFVCWMLTMI